MQTTLLPPLTAHSAVALALALAVTLFLPGRALAACPAPYLGAGNSVCTTAGSTITCDLDSATSNDNDALYYSEGYASGGNNYFRAFGLDDDGVKFCAEILLTGTQLTTLVVEGTDRTDNIYLNYGGNPTSNLAIEVYGNAGNDNIDGSNDASVTEELNGEEGNDTIDGKAGGDTIDGGTGSDTLTGGAGIDYMYGGTGIDYMYGGDDGDFMWGGGDGDFMKGGDGNDEMHGDTGADSVCGGPGTGDLLYGEDDDDILYSGSQTEYTYGGIHNAGDACSGYFSGYATDCEGGQGDCPW